MVLQFHPALGGVLAPKLCSHPAAQAEQRVPAPGRDLRPRHEGGDKEGAGVRELSGVQEFTILFSVYVLQTFKVFLFVLRLFR